MVKNVLYVCPTSSIGGAETFIKNTWLGHDKNSFLPQYLLFSEGPLADWLSEYKAPYEIVPIKPRLSRPWTWFKYIAFLRKFIQQRNIHLIHSTMAYGAIFTALATLGRIHVWFQHGPVSGWMDILAAILPHRLLFTNSIATTQLQLKLEKPFQFLIAQRTVKKINLGIDTPYFLPKDIEEFRHHIIKKHNLSESVCLIGMACRLQHWKGAHDLLKACETLTHNFTNDRSPFFVLIWGESFDDPGYVKHLKEWAQHLPASLEGGTRDARFAFSICDIVVNASQIPEPFGLTLIEGMSAGAVPVAPGWGGPAEFISHGQNGLLFEPLTTDDLAQQLKNLIEDPELRAQLKNSAKHSFLENFTVEKMIKSIEDEYKNLLKF